VHAAAADHEHAFARQRRERLAERELRRWRVARNERERDDRDVRRRVEKAQRGPRAVIEPALVDLCAAIPADRSSCTMCAASAGSLAAS
jgi:hypothetical protein